MSAVSAVYIYIYVCWIMLVDFVLKGRLSGQLLIYHGEPLEGDLNF